MSRLTQAKPKSVAAFVVSDITEAADWLPPEGGPLLVQIASRSGIWTGRIDGRVVAFCGLTPLNEFVAEAWTFLHPDATTAPCWLFRATKEILQAYAGACDFWRVQALTEEHNGGGRNWLEHLGFTFESRMPLFGTKGETLLRYVWFPKGVTRG